MPNDDLDPAFNSALDDIALIYFDAFEHGASGERRYTDLAGACVDYLRAYRGCTDDCRCTLCNCHYDGHLRAHLRTDR